MSLSGIFPARNPLYVYSLKRCDMKAKTISRAKTAKSENGALKFKTVDEYIAALPATTKNMVKELRKTIKQLVPTAEEMISYNMPSFKWHGGLIWYAAWKEHISLYPGSSAMEASIPELAAYKGAKATIKFPAGKPLPLELVHKIIKFRMKENLEKAKKK